MRAQIAQAPEPAEPPDTDGEPRPHFHVWKAPKAKLFTGEFAPRVTADDLRGYSDRELSNLAEALFRLATDKPIPTRLAKYVADSGRSRAERKRTPKAPKAPVQEEKSLLVRAGGDGWTGGSLKRVTLTQARRAYKTVRERAEARANADHKRLDHAVTQAIRLTK